MSSTSQRQLKGQVALVTGAGTGIGRAIAQVLNEVGARVCLVGRRQAPLAEAATRFINPIICTADLATDTGVTTAADTIRTHAGRLDILVHCAAVFARGPFATEPTSTLDSVLAANVRGPYALTQALLPRLIAQKGEVVFINSTAVGTSAPAMAHYTASKQALQAIANSLRAEVNEQGVRVLSLYVGRAATPMQEQIFKDEGRAFKPERLLQPADVAATVLHAITLPRTAEITDLTIRPMQKT